MKKENKGITLVALVITIIILLILAGMTIAELTETGLFTKVNQAKKQQLKAQYFEEINLEIMTEQIERTTTVKEEKLIISLKDRIRKKDWVNNIILAEIDEQGNIKEVINTEIDPNLLIINTKEGYRILIEVDNEKCTATIKDAFNKIEKMHKVKFDGNGGTASNSPEIQESDGLIGIILPENPYTKEGYAFIGWSETKEGKDPKEAKTYYLPTKDITLYAIWRKDTITISFDKNAEDATGTMNNVEAEKNTNKTIPGNNYIKEGYTFKGWMLDKNGDNAEYANQATIPVGEENITLYAKWERIRCTVTLQVEGSGTVEGAGTYDYGSVITIKAVGDNFLGWYYDSGACYSTSASIEITLIGDLILTAKFSGDVSSITLKQGYTTLTSSSEVTGYYSSNYNKYNQKIQITATVNPSNATNKDVIWTTSNSNIVSVDNNGLLEFKGISGTTKTATITCKSADGKVTSSFIARVKGERHYILNYPDIVNGGYFTNCSSFRTGDGSYCLSFFGNSEGYVVYETNYKINLSQYSKIGYDARVAGNVLPKLWIGSSTVLWSNNKIGTGAAAILETNERNVGIREKNVPSGLGSRYIVFGGNFSGNLTQGVEWITLYLYRDI